MKQICMYCNKVLGTLSEDEEDKELISHGVCPDCLPKFLAGSGQPLAEFLDTLPGPIFVIDRDVRIIATNTEGQKCVPKGAGAIHNHLAGEVFECSNSTLPGGCGQSIHCKSCTIRNAVMKTFETGNSCIGIPAYLDLGDISHTKSVRYLITTEKVNDVVLLRIDDIQEVTEPADKN